MPVVIHLNLSTWFKFVVEYKKDIPSFKGTYTRKRIDKLSTTTITPESILTEKDIVNDVCNECKRLDLTLLQCGGICPDIGQNNFFFI